jgi:adenylate kinase family enzyme
MPSRVRRIHITGGPGSGKTWLAARLSRLLEVPRFDQDGVALGLFEALGLPPILPVPPPEVEAGLMEAVVEFAAGEGWVSDASSITWASPLFDAADLVVWLDTPTHVALRRVFMRHVRAELQRDNRFPGWRRMYRFWRWSLRFYTDRNPHGPNPYGTPMTRSTLSEMLQDYSDKLVVCRSHHDLHAVERMLEAFPAARASP